MILNKIALPYIDPQPEASSDIAGRCPRPDERGWIGIRGYRGYRKLVGDKIAYPLDKAQAEGLCHVRD